ncbi:MAG: hypothetical protein WKF71_20695 [Pyrinomonadaceae bacterium]
MAVVTSSNLKSAITYDLSLRYTQSAILMQNLTGFIVDYGRYDCAANVNFAAGRGRACTRQSTDYWSITLTARFSCRLRLRQCWFAIKF